MSLFDLHIHTTFCDGKNTPEEMVLAAIEKRMDCIGFSSHSYTYFDESYCMKKTDIERYKSEIAELKNKYRGKIKILCGIEQDYYSAEPTAGYDYVIGSVHYLKSGEKFYSVDDSAEDFVHCVNEAYGGDFYLLAEDYFKTVSDIVSKTDCDIIGHFDLITKYNENGRFFDEENPRYVKAYSKAVKKLVKQGKPFEVNTGVIARVGKSSPYPSENIRELIKSLGGKFVFSSDSHSKDTLCFGFENIEI